MSSKTNSACMEHAIDIDNAIMKYFFTSMHTKLCVVAIMSGLLLAFTCVFSAQTRRATMDTKGWFNAHSEFRPNATFFFRSENELGNMTVYLYEDANAVDLSHIADTSKLSSLIVEAIIHTSARPRKRTNPAELHKPDDLRAEGIVLEVHFWLPVDQQSLGFVPRETAQLLQFTRFVIPLTGRHARLDHDHNKSSARVFPFQELGAGTSFQLGCWQTSSNVDVYSKVMRAELLRAIEGIRR